MLPVRPNRPWSDLPPQFEYRATTTQFDKWSRATAELCATSRSWIVSAPISTSSWSISRRSDQARQPAPAARLIAHNRTAAGTSTRKRAVGAARLARVVINPMQSALLQGRRTPSSRTRW